MSGVTLTENCAMSYSVYCLQPPAVGRLWGWCEDRTFCRWFRRWHHDIMTSWHVLYCLTWGNINIYHLTTAHAQAVLIQALGCWGRGKLISTEAFIFLISLHIISAGAGADHGESGRDRVAVQERPDWAGGEDPPGHGRRPHSQLLLSSVFTLVQVRLNTPTDATALKCVSISTSCIFESQQLVPLTLGLV